MEERKPTGIERERHVETRLQRDLGNSPVVETKGLVKVRAGKVIGVWIGPNDLAEMLRVADFKVASGFAEGSAKVGTMNGVDFFLLEQDIE